MLSSLINHVSFCKTEKIWAKTPSHDSIKEDKEGGTGNTTHTAGMFVAFYLCLQK